LLDKLINHKNNDMGLFFTLYDDKSES